MTPGSDATITGESRAPRFSELDAQIRAEAERQDKAKPNRKPRRRSTAPLPAAVCKEITRFAKELIGQHGQLFTNDSQLKDLAARLLRSVLPPRPRRRGRPGIDSVTKAIALLGKLRKQYPAGAWPKIWQRIYPGRGLE